MPSISRGDEAQRPLLEGGDGEGGGEGEHRAVNPVEKTPLQCVASVDFWMLFLVNGISSGAGLTLLNNLGQQARPHAGGSRTPCGGAARSPVFDVAAMAPAVSRAGGTSSGMMLDNLGQQMRPSLAVVGNAHMFQRTAVGAHGQQYRGRLRIGPLPPSRMCRQTHCRCSGASRRRCTLMLPSSSAEARTPLRPRHKVCADAPEVLSWACRRAGHRAGQRLQGLPGGLRQPFLRGQLPVPPAGWVGHPLTPPLFRTLLETPCHR